MSTSLLLIQVSWVGVPTGTGFRLDLKMILVFYIAVRMHTVVWSSVKALCSLSKRFCAPCATKRIRFSCMAESEISIANGPAGKRPKTRTNKYTNFARDTSTASKSFPILRCKFKRTCSSISSFGSALLALQSTDATKWNGWIGKMNLAIWISDFQGFPGFLRVVEISEKIFSRAQISGEAQQEVRSLEKSVPSTAEYVVTQYD